MENGWLSIQDLQNMNFKSLGENVLISSTCRIYGAHNISIGSNVRIDDFCVIASVSGNLTLEGYNHIASFCYINCNGGVHISAFANMSSRCAIYSATDDFSGNHLIGPTIPSNYTKINFGNVVLGRNSILGTGTTVFPGISIGDYSAIGACSLVNKNIAPHKIAVGIPAKIVKERSLDIIDLENDLLSKRGVNV